MLGISRHVRHLTPGIGKEFELAVCSYLGIQLAQRSRCCIARSDVSLFALSCHLLVERKKIAFGHIDLAADFHDRRNTRRKLVRYLADGADIGRHIFAGRTVPTRGSTDQDAILIADRHGKPVDLRFSRESN